MGFIHIWGDFTLELKQPKTFSEQIKILKDRGLVIKNEENAKFILSNINYYRFTAYLLQFKDIDNTYKDNITFEHINSLYMFDKELRTLLLDILGTIEISFRTYIAYTLAINHGTIGYLRKEIYIDKDFYNDFMLNLESEKHKNYKKLFIKHHMDKYDGKLPIWVAVEIMTFGMMSKLYSNMLPADKSFIKNNLCNLNVKILDTWLQSLTHLRNQCAHYGRIYNYDLPIIKIKKEYKQYSIDNKKIFSYIIAIKHICVNKEVWNRFFINLQDIINKYQEYIDLRCIGFPRNWLEILSKN